MRGRHDIEVYVEAPPTAITRWLAELAGPLARDREGDTSNGHDGALVFDTALGRVYVIPGMAGGSFVAVHFSGVPGPSSEDAAEGFPARALPWRDEADCAHEASAALGCTVRCAPGDRYPELNPLGDEFLEIARGEETIVHWPMAGGAADDDEPREDDDEPLQNGSEDDPLAD